MKAHPCYNHEKDGIYAYAYPYKVKSDRLRPYFYARWRWQGMLLVNTVTKSLELAQKRIYIAKKFCEFMMMQEEEQKQ